MMLDTTRWQPITLPDLGEEKHPIRVSTWLTQIGEEVVEGEPVVEVLMNGITFDIEASDTGRLRRISHFENDVVAAGDSLGWIESDVADASCIRPTRGDSSE